MKRLVPTLLLLLSAVSLSQSQIPVITSFSPQSGSAGATLLIAGTNFDATPQNNIVFLGAVKASVISASTTQLSVRIPVSASYAPISVTVGGLTGTSSDPFMLTFAGGDTAAAAGFAFGNTDFPAGTLPYSTAISDLDGDGKPDIVVTNYTGKTISVFRNMATGTPISTGSFAAAVTFPTGTDPWGIAIGDLDGDGKPDIVVSNGTSGTISIFRNTCDSGTIAVGSFAPKVDFSGGSGYGIAIADLDGDGKPDIAASSRNGNVVSVLRNTGTVGSITSASFAAAVNFPTGSVPYGIAISDLDGDGKPDLAVGNLGSGTISVFRNTSTAGTISSGSFAAKVDFVQNGNPIGIAIGDANKDGRPEIFSANQGDSTISILQNAAASGSITNGSFAAAVTMKLNGSPNSIALGDFNGDAKPDIVVVNGNSDKISLFQNSITTGGVIAGNSFIASTDLPTARYPYGAAVGDLDGDGKFDVVAANSGSNSISVFNFLRTYTRPGRPVSCAVSPSGWSKTGLFTITWNPMPTGMLPIIKLYYAVDTLPKNAAVLKNQSIVGDSAMITITDIGKHTVHFFLEDSLGNKNQDSIGTVLVKFDNKGPAIIHANSGLDTIVVRSDGSTTVIPPIIAAAIDSANGSGAAALTLRYKRLDEQNWTTVAFPGVTGSSIALPASAFITNGIAVGTDYRLQATDSAGNSTMSRLLSFELRCESDLALSPLSQLPSVLTLNLPEGQEAKAYRMFSIPYEPVDKTPVVFMNPGFGAHAEQGIPYVRWRMLRRVNETWDDYDSFKDSAVVVPGAGFLLVSREQGKAMTLRNPGVVRSDKMLYTGIKLQRGWNLVGNPFLVNIPFDRLIFEGGNHVDHWYYSGTGPRGGWDPSGANVDTLKSWQGLAVKVDSASILKFNVTSVTQQSASVLSKQWNRTPAASDHQNSSNEWTLTFDALRTDIDMSCRGTEIGMKADALRGFDAYDRHDAPFIGTGSILASVRTDAGLLMKDMRPVSTEGDVWDVLVATGDGNARVTLSFGGLDAITRQGFDVLLIDSTVGLAYDIRKQNSFSVGTGNDGTRLFRIAVGTRAFVEKCLQGSALIPNAPRLYGNYPNPFNPETIIRYAVPGTMTSARVQLKIFNVLGQEVRTLLNEDASPGFYEVLFDGKDLCSGTYFYRITFTTEAASFEDTKKMLLIK